VHLFWKKLREGQNRDKEVTENIDKSPNQNAEVSSCSKNMETNIKNI
jgi:hypothetical protein